MSILEKVKNTINLLSSVDMDQLAKIDEKTDLAERFFAACSHCWPRNHRQQRFCE